MASASPIPSATALAAVNTVTPPAPAAADSTAAGADSPGAPATLTPAPTPTDAPAQAEAVTLRRANIPFIDTADVVKDRLPEMAVVWYGRVRLHDNYTDVRLGYNRQTLYIRAAVIDHFLTYPEKPAAPDLVNWDTLSVYIKEDGSGLTGAYRIDSAWSPARMDRGGYTAAYRGGVGGWLPVSLPLDVTVGYRGKAYDNARGYGITIAIPFSALGLDAPPPADSTWRLAFVTHDRDDPAGQPAASFSWPEQINPDDPATWGQLGFALPVFAAPPAKNPRTYTIRQGVDGGVVSEAGVGGSTICGNKTDFFNQWGDLNERWYQGERGVQFANVQNQADIADFPCYSKVYLTAQLGTLPPGKKLISARLVLRQFGGSKPDEAVRSWIQVYRVGQDWDDANVSWNNAPLPVENFGGVWVDVLADYPGLPGVARTWDVSYAAAQAYAAGQPLRLALYSADFNYHSGKYFWTSQVENVESRPLIEVVLGD